MSEPWKTEPDAMDWVSETGFHCAIRREPDMGHLCGYVAVSPGHPWHGKDYMSIDVDTHGGLTFSAMESKTRDIRSGDPAAFWVGFDCAHSGDMSPASVERGWPAYDAVYRNIRWVSAEVERLAEQAAQALKEAI